MCFTMRRGFSGSIGDKVARAVEKCGGPRTQIGVVVVVFCTMPTCVFSWVVVYFLGVVLRPIFWRL
jgi:hypothetical protein